MDLGILTQAGEILLHRHMKAAPEPFLQAMAPYRDDRVVCVECLLTWDWLADLCAHEGSPCVLGHALSLKASHGGTAQNDTIDAPTIAVLRRGGMLPQASVYPATRRATRDLLRRRMHLVRQRAELLAHIQPTTSQSHLPAIGKQLAYKANRAGVAERFPEPAVQKSMALALTLLEAYDRLVTDLARDRVSTATAPDAQTFYRLRALPGVGKLLALVRLSELQDINRCPRVQAFVSSGRLVKGATESAGTRSGTAGNTIGHAYLQGAFSAAAVLFRRHHPAGQQDLARFERRQGQGKALPVLAHTRARAVYEMLKRHTAFERAKVLPESRSGVGAPAASLDAKGRSLAIGARRAERLRQRMPPSTSAFSPDPWPLIARSLRLPQRSPCSNMLDVGCPSPAPGPHGRLDCLQPPL